MSDAIKCAIYARYSTVNQREASIDDQIRNCRDAALQKGWEVLEGHIYYDKIQSGRRIASREAFKEMMRMAMSDNSPFRRIIVDDTSRIARNTKEALDIFSLLCYCGVYVYYVSQGIDTSHETAEEMITINGLIDSLYIRNLSKETHRGIEGQIYKGYSGGGRRYGYRSEPVYSGKVDIYGNPEVDGYAQRINADEAHTVVRIFQLFGEEGYSAIRIADLLNAEMKESGSPKPPGGKFWCMSTILGSKKIFRGILNNEIYIGKYYWNRTLAKINPENGKKRSVAKDKRAWLVVERPELRIVPDSLWEKVKNRQRQLKTISGGKYMKARQAYSKNLLTGLMICGECGGNIVIVSGGKYAKYGCSNNWNRGYSVCGNSVKIGKDDLHKKTLDTFGIDLDHESIITYLLDRTRAIIEERGSPPAHKWRGDALEDQLKKTRKEIDNFVSAIRAGIITETVKRQLLVAEKKKRRLERIAGKSERSKSERIELSNTMIRHYAVNLHRTLILHPPSGRAFLEKIVDRIVLKPSADSITLDVLIKDNAVFVRPDRQMD